MDPIITLYNYNDNGFFIGTSVARMSPLEPEVPLIPRNATLIAPAQKEDDTHKLKFINNQWSLVEIVLPNNAIDDVYANPNVDPILLQIQTLEGKITARRFREAILGIENPPNFLADTEAQIAALRSQLNGG